MALNGGSSGFDWKKLHENQVEGFQTLETILKEGFDKVAGELMMLREQGYIPIDIHEKMIRQINEINASVMLQYKTFITVIVRALCFVIMGLVLWLTGLKYLAPHIFGG